jgi:glyoxylase-like metal-dependent hydrolase (beta-lactamase superfamily II)
MQPVVTPFHDAATGTWSYVVADAAAGAAAIIDPVLEYESKSARTATRGADRIVTHCREHSLQVRWILETHAHADHLSAAQYLKAALGGEVAIGAGIRSVQRTFKTLLGLGPEFIPDGRQFDCLLEDDATLPLGHGSIHVLPTPGHTSDSVSYLIGDAVFIGDTLFMPDSGSARCDFPGGDAAELYRSVQRLYLLPPGMRVFVCHDYSPGGRAPVCETTIEEQRRANTHLHEGVDEAVFVQLRSARDATLDLPALIIPSVQVNIRAGELPPPEADGVRYLRLPVNVFGKAKS